MKKLILTIIAIVILAVSCSKEDNIQKIDTDVDLGFIGLNEGQLHNELLEILMNNWTISDKDETSIVSEVHRILISNTTEFSKSNNFDHTEFLNQANACDENTIKSQENILQEGYLASIGISPTLQAEIDNFVKTFYNISGSEHVEDIKEMLLEHYYSHIGKLSNEDKLLFGTMIDVAIHSAKFWFPVEQGGQNKYVEFKKKLSIIRNGNDLDLRGFWSDIILADAAGAVTTAAISLVNSGGLTAIPNPALGGIPTAGVVAVIGGAGASIAKAI